MPKTDQFGDFIAEFGPYDEYRGLFRIYRTFNDGSESDAFRGSCKWDGCYDTYTERISGARAESHPGLHICEMDGFIKALQWVEQMRRSLLTADGAS